MSPPDDNDGNTHAGNAAEGNGSDCRVSDGTFHPAAPASVRPHRSRGIAIRRCEVLAIRRCEVLASRRAVLASRRAVLRRLAATATAAAAGAMFADRAATDAPLGGPWARRATAQPLAAEPPAAGPLPWLEEVRRPPAGFATAASVTTGAAPTLPLLVPAADRDDTPADAAGPFTAAAWPATRDRIEQAWRDLLGPIPAPPPLAVEVLAEDEVEGCRRQRVRYACEQDLLVEATLLFPPDDVPPPPRGHPGVVAFHSTTDSTNECLAGFRDGPDRRLGVVLARRGFVTACPRCFLWQEPGGYSAQVRRFRARHPGTLGMRKMLHDGSRAVDLLAATAAVDADRIGCCGHSLGAKEALYLAAFDHRIRAAVAHDGGLGRRQSNWEADWYLGPDVPDRFDHHQLLALAAPRPLLVQGGGAGAADGAASWPFVAAALPIYRALPGPAALGLDIHDGGHRLTDRAVARLVAWLAAFLVS